MIPMLAFVPLHETRTYPPYPLFSGSPYFNSVTHPHYSYPMKSTAMRNSYGRMDAGADDGECLGCAAR